MDGPKSDEVRRYLVENALYWVREFHADALRLDAIHAIHDEIASPFLMELAEVIGRHAVDLNRPVHLIAESDLNDVRGLRRPDQYGLGLDARWAADFHHCVFTLLTTAESPYHRDYNSFDLLVNAYQHGYAYTGQFCASRERRHGNLPIDLHGRQFVICIQNHDQIGNRKFGERLRRLATFEAQMLAVGTVLLAPYVPMLFTEEEYGETAPFQYFVDFSDPALVQAVREGRKSEFEMQGGDDPPDPAGEGTFRRSKLNHELREGGRHRTLLDFYRELLRIRRESPAIRFPDKDRMRLAPRPDQRALLVTRWDGDDQTLIGMNYSARPVRVGCSLPRGTWVRALESAEPPPGRPGHTLAGDAGVVRQVSLELAPTSIAVYKLCLDPITNR